MKLLSLHKKILSVGGTSEIKQDQHGKDELNGRIWKYRIHMYWNDFFTLTHDDKEYDYGSDYNPSGAIFCKRIKDISYYAWK